MGEGGGLLSFFLFFRDGMHGPNAIESADEMDVGISAQDKEQASTRTSRTHASPTSPHAHLHKIVGIVMSC